MTLGEFIKKYRTDHDMSMDKFSELSGISKSYISLLEKNRHPKTGKPIMPSIKCIRQVSDCVHIDFNMLFSMLNGDEPLSEEEPAPTSVDFVLSDQEREILIEYRRADNIDREMVRRILKITDKENNEKMR